MTEVEFIIYVADQEKSTEFYTELLKIEPSLNVPGMTEFKLFDFVKLGIMPEKGIAKILSNKTPHPSDGNGIPRCELYLKVENPQKYMDRGINMGGKEISKIEHVVHIRNGRCVPIRKGLVANKRRTK